MIVRMARRGASGALLAVIVWGAVLAASPRASAQLGATLAEIRATQQNPPTESFRVQPPFEEGWELPWAARALAARLPNGQSVPTFFDLRYAMIQGRAAYVLLTGIAPKAPAHLEAFLSEQYPAAESPPPGRRGRQKFPWSLDGDFDAIFPPLGRVDRRTAGGDWRYGKTRSFRQGNVEVRITDVYMPTNVRHVNAALGRRRFVARHDDGRAIAVWDWTFDEEHHPHGMVLDVLLTDVDTFWPWLLTTLSRDEPFLRTTDLSYDEMMYHDPRATTPAAVDRVHNALVLATFDEHLDLAALEQAIGEIEPAAAAKTLGSLNKFTRLPESLAARRERVVAALAVRAGE